MREQLGRAKDKVELLEHICDTNDANLRMTGKIID
ncbi:hypothetical protein AZE42_11399 [Rhizopogon vesiculosus]|uniref:Uncharacterized protein n=1 Tax=Rhizopogon vesiculosus TaxID=180088 RepID=A0A1J8Q887_9AGAM|nr:hypothetical protein AZE42_11399 [Rhizopogon vesiculosus]